MSALSGSPDTGTDRWPEILRACRRPRHAAPVAKPTGWRRLTSRRPHRSRPHGRLSRGRLRRQISVVCRRQIKLLRADPGYLAFLALMPLALAGLALTVPGGDGLGPPRGLGGGEAMRLLVVLIVGATFTGTAASIRDLVAERAIFQYSGAGLSRRRLVAKLLLRHDRSGAGGAAGDGGPAVPTGPATALLPGFGTLGDSGGGRHRGRLHGARPAGLPLAVPRADHPAVGGDSHGAAGAVWWHDPGDRSGRLAAVLAGAGSVGAAAAAGTVDLRTIVVGAPDDRLCRPIRPCG